MSTKTLGERSTTSESPSTTTPSSTTSGRRPGPLQKARRVMLGDPSEENKAEALAAAHLARVDRREKARQEREDLAEAKQARRGSKRATLLGLVPLVAISFTLRALVIMADYLLAIIVAMAVIPSLGAWMHQQSGVAQSNVTDAGVLAVWIAPFTFLILLITAGVLVLMRAMWRGASRTIARVRDSREARATASAMSVDHQHEGDAKSSDGEVDMEEPSRAAAEASVSRASTKKHNHHHNRGNRKRSKN